MMARPKGAVAEATNAGEGPSPSPDGAASPPDSTTSGANPVVVGQLEAEADWRDEFGAGIMPSDTIERRQRYVTLRLWELRERGAKITQACLGDKGWADKDNEKRKLVREHYNAVTKALATEVVVARDERVMLGVSKGERGQSGKDPLNSILDNDATAGTVGPQVGSSD